MKVTPLKSKNAGDFMVSENRVDIGLYAYQVQERNKNISQHIEGIYRDKELEREATNKKFLLVQTEGQRKVKRNIDHYNLDIVILIE